MAYSGTTAASSVTNPPIKLVDGIGNFNPGIAVVGSTASSLQLGGGNSLWYYQTTDGTTVLEVSSYFSDGGFMGMKNGDSMIGVCASSFGSTVVISFHGVLQTTSTFGSSNFGAPSAFGLSTGGTMSSTFT